MSYLDNKPFPSVLRDLLELVPKDPYREGAVRSRSALSLGNVLPEDLAMETRVEIKG
jgi:hypothetical protein